MKERRKDDPDKNLTTGLDINHKYRSPLSIGLVL